MPEKLRCGVIGAGAAGTEHLYSLLSCPRAAAVAIAETHPQRAREASERFKISRSYVDFRELLEQPDIDAVTIAVPNHLHASMTLEALRARKHVLVETPLATNLKEAHRISETAKAMKRSVMTAQTYRFNRHTQAARMLVERGELGDVYHAHCFWLRRQGIPRIGSWYTQKQLSGGGCAVDLGIQLLDTGLHLLKDFEVVSVSAQAHGRFGGRGVGECERGKSEVDPKRPFDVEDLSVALLKLKSGKTLIMEAAWAGFRPANGREHGIDLMGTSGGLSLYPARLLRNCPEGDRKSVV